jgi:hypothetical protein
MPLVIGGCAIAEERKFGVRAWHLTLPTSYRTQWLAKLAVVFTITALLGMAVPFAWCCLCPSLCPSLSPLGKPSFDSIVPLIATPLLVTAVALYASSFARDTLRAILGALGICAGFGLAVDILSQAAGKVEPFSVPLLLPLVERLADGVQNLRFQPAIWTAVSVISLVLLVSLLVGAFFHFRAFERTSERMILTTLFAFVPTLFLIFVLFSLTLAASHLRFDIVGGKVKLHRSGEYPLPPQF